MHCPQCGADVPEDAWNCPACRINLYWAHQHFEELAHIRTRQGLRRRPDTPPFLIAVHERELAERARRGGNAMTKVRQVARRVMRDESREAP